LPTCSRWESEEPSTLHCHCEEPAEAGDKAIHDLFGWIATAGFTGLAMTNKEENTEATGLPGIRRWRTVYWVVFGIFVLWVSLLTWLTRSYS
jgi:hypothetical protein